MGGGDVGKAMQKARRRAHQEFAPQNNAIGKEVRASKRATRLGTRTARKTYGLAGKAIGELGGMLPGQFGAVKRGYLGGIGKGADLLGGGGSVAGMTAAGDMAGAQVGGTLGQLAGISNSAIKYNAGMGEALQHEGARVQRQYQLDHQTALEEAARARQALAQQESARAAEIAESIREQRAERRQAQWLAEYLQNKYERMGARSGGDPRAGRPPLSAAATDDTLSPGSPAEFRQISSQYDIPQRRPAAPVMPFQAGGPAPVAAPAQEPVGAIFDPRWWEGR